MKSFVFIAVWTLDAWAHYEQGGISDRPNDEPDVYHTFFGVAGLSLMGFPGLKAVDPVYALPTEVVQRLGLYE